MKQFNASKVIDSWGGCYVLVATNDRLRRGTDGRQGMRAFNVRGRYSHLTYPLVNRLGSRFPLRARHGLGFLQRQPQPPAMGYFIRISQLFVFPID